jgi:hypothetical protein
MKRVLGKNQCISLEAEGLAELPELLRSLREHVNNFQRKEWDRFRVEYWLDSGRVILYPSLSSSRCRIDDVVGQLFLPDVLREWETLGDAIEAGMDECDFEKAAGMIESKVRQQISGALKEFCGDIELIHVAGEDL